MSELTIRRALEAVLNAFSEHDQALANYFAEHGAEHEYDECPEDDTCDCPLLVALRDGEKKMRQAVSVAQGLVSTSLNREGSELPSAKMTIDRLVREIETIDSVALPSSQLVAFEKLTKTLERNGVAQSVLRDWVMCLPLREQGTLLTAIRGCDLTPKYPLDSLERRLVAAIRFAVMIPADEREVDAEPGCFMLSKPPRSVEFKPSALGHYPQHWVAHVMHACQVIAYRHPDAVTGNLWLTLYHKFCHSLHVRTETLEQFVDRMSEDRIAAGTVVS